MDPLWPSILFILFIIFHGPCNETRLLLKHTHFVIFLSFYLKFFFCYIKNAELNLITRVFFFAIKSYHVCMEDIGIHKNYTNKNHKLLFFSTYKISR